MDVVNSTPWRTAWTLALDSDGFEQLTLVVKATYALRPSLAVCEEPCEVVVADEFHGDPAWSSLKHASDMAPRKNATDFLVSGHVVPLRRDPTRGGARLRCGRIDKTVAAVGDRVWQSTGVALAPSAPRPFERIPLQYERAFGGRDETTGSLTFAPQNPAGIGFRAVNSKAPILGTPVANLEHPAQPIRDPNQPVAGVGMGPVAGHWLPRRQYGGSYDAAWQRERAPLLPSDFDLRYHQVAPADQIYNGFVQGGEPVSLQGMRVDGALDFALPYARPEIAFRYHRQSEEQTPPCDAVLIDAERARLCMVFRARTRVHGRLSKLLFMGVRARGL